MPRRVGAPLSRVIEQHHRCYQSSDQLRPWRASMRQACDRSETKTSQQRTQEAVLNKMIQDAASGARRTECGVARHAATQMVQMADGNGGRRRRTATAHAPTPHHAPPPRKPAKLLDGGARENGPAATSEAGGGGGGGGGGGAGDKRGDVERFLGMLLEAGLTNRGVRCAVRMSDALVVAVDVRESWGGGLWCGGAQGSLASQDATV